MNVFGIGLPEIGRSMGKALRGFQDASKEFESEFKREAQNIEESVKMQARLEEEKTAAKVESDSAS
jgi:sec-independent protein translocase protein TatA